ncbi:hypothetical protein [Synechococcus sp. MU1642]|uniref:hypothetical protein n=1 Tax=Synechococcus sp. MU1642 TaxID=2508348 RepID=UPI001CF87866|nr:hypothetical protein [Synechococcus sp. MU1642]
MHASAVADLDGFKVSRRLVLLLWAIVHLALIPNREKRITLSIKWLYALATRQRASILLTGMPCQHLALDAGLACPLPDGQRQRSLHRRTRCPPQGSD